jgi:hypothetical protein
MSEDYDYAAGQRMFTAIMVGALTGLICAVAISACPDTEMAKGHYKRGHCEALGGKIVDDKCMHVTPLEEK